MKLIDADALWMEFIHRMDYCDDILEIVEEMPEAVVRCEDCVHCADDYVDTGFGAMPCFTCDLFEGYGVGIKPGHYCSYGERNAAESG